MRWFFDPLSAVDTGAHPRPRSAAEQNVSPFPNWLQSFEQRHRRALRVLHIGNIANNAYNNAKIQRERGIQADVLSFDYYHIMATPEWEDADFSGQINDDYYPDWWAVDLKGFRRPRWFVAGPIDISVRYLLAMNAGRRSAFALWYAVEFERWLLCRRHWTRDVLLFLIHKLTGATVTPVAAPANALVLRAWGRWLHRIAVAPPLRWARIGARVRRFGDKLERHGRTANLYCDEARKEKIRARYFSRTKERIEQLLRAVGREDVPEDFAGLYAIWLHPLLRLLFSRYDIVQCYATYTAMPFLIGLEDYVAYEHGTIRHLPFAPTTEGRLCLATYRAAAAVLVTNMDNIAAAEQMAIEPERIVALPHAFDSDKLLRFWRESAGGQPEPGRPATFVMSARQHWVDNDPGWAKGNDRVFSAMRAVKDSGRYCILRAVAWGNDLEASRQMINQLGIADMVQWIPTMKKRKLWQEYLNADAVIDQFVVPAFGGVTFEALMLGRRVITALDENVAQRFFGSVPPIVNCRTSADICAAMIRIIDDPTDRMQQGMAGQEWMQRYHSADRIVSLQVGVYRRLLEGYVDAEIPVERNASSAAPTAAAAPDAEQSAGPSEVVQWMRQMAPFYTVPGWARSTTGGEIVMLVVSALRIDPRVEREARALAAAGWHIRIVAPDISSPLLATDPIDWGPGISFRLLPFDAAQYITDGPGLVSEAMYQAAVEFRPFAYHCHDLNTALIGFRAASTTGARWVCDFHEWSSENVTWNGAAAAWEPHESQKVVLLRWAERVCLRRADVVITVNHSIARELERMTGAEPGRVKVIRNIPALNALPTQCYPSLKAQFGLPEEQFVVLYQGGTGPTRLLEPVIQALSYAPEVVLVIRGPSLDLFGEHYRSVANSAGVADRLILADAVPSRDVVAAAHGADAGLWTLPNLSKNFYYALPNKVFEYLAAGLPLLVAEFPEPKAVVKELGVGLVFDPYDPISIGTQIKRLSQDRDLAARCREAIPQALRALDACTEWERLSRIYDDLRGAGEGARNVH